MPIRGQHRNRGGNNHNHNHRNNDEGSDTLMYEAHNGAPVTGSCHNCGQDGHRAKNCPSRNFGSRNGNRMNGANHGGQQNQNQNQWKCTFCKKNNHSTEKCFRDPNSPSYRGPPGGNNQNNNTNGNTNNNNNNNKPQGHYQKKKQPLQINGYPIEGYVFKSRMPEYEGPEKYCLFCNTREHFQKDCPEESQGYARLRHSKLSCWRCCFKGHTADECQHPEQQVCAACHKPGHDTRACDERWSREVRGQLHSTEKRFLWGGRGMSWVQKPKEQELREAWNAKQAELAEGRGQMAVEEQVWWNQQLYAAKNPFGFSMELASSGYRYASAAQNLPAFDSCSTTSSGSSGWPASPEFCDLSNNAEDRMDTSFYDPDHEAALAAKIHHAASTYHKQNYNATLIRLDAAIQEHNVLSPNTHFHLKKFMAQGCQFWRDPRAIEALVKRERPLCHCCGGEGKLLDRHMRADVVERSALEVEDFTDWGVFVMFECRCCNGGYSYVGR